MAEMAEMEEQEVAGIIAAKFARRLPAHIDKDDIEGVALLAACEIRARFDESKGVKFKTYASPRVEGAVIDYLRGLDWVPRGARKKSKELIAAHAKTSQDLGAEADPSAVAAELGITVEELHARTDDVAQGNVASLDGASNEEGFSLAEVVGCSNPTPAKIAEDNELAGLCLDALSDVERAVVFRTIVLREKLKDVGQSLGFGESWACQIRNAAMKKMRAVAA